MPDQTPVYDWPAIFAEVRAGVISKGEICRKYNISIGKLSERMLRDGIVYGELRGEVSRQVAVLSTTAQLSDAEIVGVVADRQMGLIKSHLTLTRKLHIRLNDLLEGYDEVVKKATQTNPETGETEINPKGWLLAAQLFDGVTKVAQRITTIEMNTLSVKVGDVVTATDPVDEIESTSDPLEASLVYQRMMDNG